MTSTSPTSNRAGAGTIVPVRDTHLYVEDIGTGPALLFIHGMCGDAEVWRGQVHRLAHRYRCITYDRRGHARSSLGDAPESVATHAEDAAALIAALGARPIVVGSSGGARIGVELLRRHPDLVAGAVLSEPPIFGLDPDTGESLRAEIATTVRAAAADGGPRAAVDAFFALVCSGLWSTLDERGKERYRVNAGMMLAEFAGPPYELTPGDVAAIDVPALVLTGSASPAGFRAIARALASGLPNARLVELAGSGHVTYAERPDEFAQLVTRFAGELDARGSRPAVA